MKGICKVLGCEERYYGKGYCKRHYNQFKRHGEILTTWLDRPRICKVDGCESKCYGKGFCYRHYQQIRCHGIILKRTGLTPNEIIVKGIIAYIQLYNRQNTRNGVAIIDSEDINKIKSYKWSKDDAGYVSTRKNGKTTRIHNFILNQITNREIQVDHKNRIKYDYRKSNLRLCTSSENHCNCGIQSNNTSGFKGVYRHRKKWVAQIKINGKQYYLGIFKDKKKAAMVRDRAAMRFHGKFAVLNFPKEIYCD